MFLRTMLTLLLRPGLAALGFALLLTACAYDNAEELLGSPPPTPTCDSTAITYGAVVAPLLQQRCLSCHNNTIRNGDVSVQTYAQVQVLARTGQLVGVVSHAPGYKPMPDGGPKLSVCEIESIRRWVAAGAPNN